MATSLYEATWELFLRASYERHVVRRFRSLCRRSFGVDNAHVIYSFAAMPEDLTFDHALTGASAAGLISEDDACWASDAEIVVAKGQDADGDDVYVVAAHDLSARVSDVDRALKAGRIVALVTGVSARPVLVSPDISDLVRERAAEQQVAIAVLPEKEY